MLLPGMPFRKKGMWAEAIHASISSSLVLKSSTYTCRSDGSCRVQQRYFVRILMDRV